MNAEWNHGSSPSNSSEHSLFEEWWDDAIIVDSNESIFDWLKAQNFETWHRVALGWNWDHGCNELFWIVSQAECDLGTACYILFVEAINYAACSNKEELEYEDYKTSWDTCDLILRRIKEDSFINKELHPWVRPSREQPYVYGQQVLKSELKNLVERGISPAWTIPETAYRYKGNRPANSDFTYTDGWLLEDFSKWYKRRWLFRSYLSLKAWIGLK